MATLPEVRDKVQVKLILSLIHLCMLFIKVNKCFKKCVGKILLVLFIY